ncbi:MAG: hypothetical protein ABIR39_06270 [Nocardioides sp.]|uniref:hypothetical protein n=1 Tax=Nocardioides sp. TaxID=35761 RepID=UPI0032651B2F
MTNYNAPAAAVVSETLRRIPTVTLRRAFYEKLLNPLWVKPLFEAGAFASPPEPQVTDDGYIRDIYWPEISYLVRVAPASPADVVDVLLSLKDTNNAWVKRAVFEIGSQIPAAQGARLKPLIQAWVTSETGFGWRSDPRELVSFAIALLEGGQTKTGRWFANHLFAPRPSKSDNSSRRDPELALEEYWYQTELPRLVPALGVDALSTVAGWLAAYSGHANDGHDFSGMRRPSIRSRGGSHSSAEDALVDVVRDLAVTAVLEAPEQVAKLLLGSGVQLLRKITLFVVAEAIRLRVEAELDATYLLPLAQRLLGDDSSDDQNLRVEYAELAQAVASVDTSALDVINGFIAHAYTEDLKWMRERLVAADTPDEEATAEVTERADRYKHSMLSAIGADALPPPLRAELETLDATHGVIEGDLTPIGMITSWTGPNPFSSQDEMAAMSPIELVEHLASWHDTGDGWGPEPSHEGQGRAQTGLLTSNPLAVVGVGGLVGELRPTYLRAILDGWQAALKADLELDWSQAAELIRDVLAHSDESSFPVEGGNMDDDKDFRGAKSAAVGLLGELVKVRENVSIPAAALAEFADLLIRGADDEEAWVEYDAYEPGENGWDPLNMSLNWQWPERLRALIHLASRAEEAPWQQGALAAIERELARSDQHGAGRAVLGESLARLLNGVPDWMKAHAEESFGSKEGLSVQQQVTLSTAMATHYYHRELFDLLSGSMVAAIDIGDGIARGWRSESDPVTKIGEWVIDALIYGHKTLEDPVVRAFFTTVKADVRGEALGTIAWSFFRAGKVDEPIRDRFASLLDERLRHVKDHPEDHAELKGLYWLAKGDKFPVDWWLPRLKEALELEPAIATERYMIGKELAHASSVEPATAFAVLRLLLAGREDGGMVSFDLTRHAVPVVLANAIGAGDPALRGEAEAYMHALGAKGYLQLDDEVKAVLNGVVTLADVQE